MTLIQLAPDLAEDDETFAISSPLIAALDDTWRQWLAERWNDSTRIFSYAWADNVKLCHATECRRGPWSSEVGNKLCRSCSGDYRDAGSPDLEHWLKTYVPRALVLVEGPADCVGVVGCQRPAEGLGLCLSHYRRWCADERPDIATWSHTQAPFPDPGACVATYCDRKCTLYGSARTKTLCRHHKRKWETSGLMDEQFDEWKVNREPIAVMGADVWLGELQESATAEFLYSLAAQAAAGTKANPSHPRMIAQAARKLDVSTLSEIPRDYPLGKQPHIFLSAWCTRLAVASADPETEWLSDSVRLSVVRRDPQLGLTLPMGRIVQPWLRQLITEYCRASLASLTPRSLANYVAAIGDLSAYLATRADGGRQARALTRRAMDGYARYLEATPLAAKSQKTRLEAISSVITQCQAFGLARKYGLAPDFRVFKQHYTKRMVDKSFDQRAFPDATFRFLMGADDILGTRVLDLLKSLPRVEFDGSVAVQALHLSANFGRRSNELFQLKADRVRSDDGTGQAAILYDNFKSGRSRVWLPIDARSSEKVSDWIAELRNRFPATGLAELALLPAPSRNPDGTRALKPVSASRWFRAWTRLLEQAIMIAHIHKATGSPVSVICNLMPDAFQGDTLVIGGQQLELAPALSAMLADYLHALRERFRDSEYEHDLPMFPCPMLFSASLTDHPSGQESPAVSPQRFAALGDGWEDLAAQYSSYGIPGGQLGQERISAESLVMRRFRHTYLQHLVDIGTDIFVVQELADHGSVQTTIDSYVRVRNEALREAVDALNEHRIDRFRKSANRTTFIPSVTTRDVATNRCANPQVLRLGTEGCDYDRQCYDCDHYSTDPSYLRDIKAEIMTCRKSLQRLEAEGGANQKTHHIEVLKERLAGWKEMLSQLETHLNSLPTDERERVLVAADIVWTFRNRIKAGGPLTLGSTTGGLL